jgi:WD40 repeat protein/serine/threonine protein kinase
MSEPTNREKEIFNEALEMGTLEARSAYVRGACGTDYKLRERVAALLKAYESANHFIPHRTRRVDEIPTVASSVQLTERQGTVIDRYRLLEKIGEGGFGVVYVAEQREPVKRRVALKIIKLGMDTRQVVARFEAERQSLAMMDHPNIAKVLDAGATETGRPYFVMELVRGIPITQYCDENHLAADERLKLFILVCQAIQHAHQKGIIHRDIKPSNILVTVNDGLPVPKVIDFGIAKATQGELTDKTIYTQFQQFIGTPAYMSPEQADMTSLDIDTRSDIYALGVLLYELLVGKTPFDSKELLLSGIDEMRRTIREKEPIRPSTRLDSLSGEERTTTAKRRGADLAKLTNILRGDVDWIVMKCLEKDRTRRYDTANSLAADIKRFLANEPVMARPPSTAYQFQKAFRRNRTVFTAAATVGVVLVLGVIVSTWQAFEARRARNAEKKQRLFAQTESHKAQTAQKEAERAQAAEKQERLRANAEKVTAQRLFYVADMQLIQTAWDQSNIPWLRTLLEETQDSLERGFEWSYWQRQAHLALRTLLGHLDDVMSVAFSPDGQRIVTGSWDHTAKVWAADSGRELLTLKGHSAGSRSWAFSPDGQRIATGSKDQTAKVWDTASGRELLTLKGHSAGIGSVAFSPDGQRIVSGSSDQTAKVWNLFSGRELLTLKGHSNGIISVTFSPDGQRIVTGSGDNTAKEWEATSGRELLTLKGHSDSVLSASYSPDGQRIVTGSWDHTAKVWAADSGRELLTLKGHSAEIRSVTFSPDGQRIVTGSADETAKVWDAASGRELFTIKGHSDAVSSASYSPDGRWIVTGSADKTAKLWVATDDREVLILKGHTNLIRSMASSPDGQRIVTGSEDRTAKVWDAANGRELFTLKGHSDRITSLAYSPDGQRIATGSSDETAKVWDAASGKELLTLQGHSNWVFCVAFSPDSQRIVTGSGDKTAKVWDVASGREVLALKGHSDRINSVAYSPDGQRIVTGSDDQTAKVWDTASGRELLTLKGHSASVESVAYSPDGHRIVTGSADRTAKVWDAAGGREVLTLKGHSDLISSVTFSPDGSRIVTASFDGTAKVWYAALPEQVAAWQVEERTAQGANSAGRQ